MYTGINSSAYDEVGQLLKSAVWYIDAADPESTDALAKNLGSAGSVINAVQSTPANQPKKLNYVGIPYIYLPGIVGNHMSVPHAAGTQYGDIMDLRADLEAEDFTPAATTLIMAKGTSTPAASSSWVFGLNSSNRVYATFSDGTNQASINTAMSPLPVDNVRTRLRVTYQRNTGAGQYLINAYSSTDVSAPLSTSTAWTLIASSTGASINATWDIAVDPTFGTNRPSSAGPAGKYYAASVSVNGSVVINIDTSVIASGSQTSFLATTGQTVTINRPATGRKSVAVTAPCYLFGSDDWLESPDDPLLDFDATDSFTVVAAYRQWNYATEAVVAKHTSQSTSGTGYSLCGSATGMRFTINSGGLRAIPEVAPTIGSFSTVAGIRNTATDQVSIMNLATVTTVTDTTVAPLTNTFALRVGRLADAGTGYAAMEFAAAAIFRRVLTPAEIQAVSNYFLERSAPAVGYNTSMTYDSTMTYGGQ